MEKNYQVLATKNSFGIDYAKQESLLAIGIMDTGSKDDLEKSVKWYTKNFNHSIHVITQIERVYQESLQTRYPDVTFIAFQKAPTLAQRINAFANECTTTYLYVTRSDIETVMFSWEQLHKKMKQEDHIATLTPLIFNMNQELTPSVRAPQLNKKGIDVLSFVPSKNDDINLYPFLGLGIYERALFQRLRGFDEEIKGAFWQVLDFGTRCWLYGYKIYSVNYMAVIFPEKQFLIEDRSDCIGIERFYTKALCVTMNRNGEPKVKKSFRTDKKVMEEEVKPRANMYRRDFQTLCAFWNVPKEEE